MDSARGTTRRCLRLFVAALALLVGSGAHQALHGSGAADAVGTMAPYEAHGAGCEHFDDLVPHDDSCVLCKLVRQHAPTPRAHSVRLDASRDGARLAVRSADRVAMPSTAGPLGARAPPVTVG